MVLKMKIKCICGETFNEFEEYAHHAKDCKDFQMNQDRTARLKIEKELETSK